MPPKGTRPTGSSYGSTARHRQGGPKPPGVRGFSAFAVPPTAAGDPPSDDEWPTFAIIESLSRNLGTDAELVALTAEHARLIAQCEAAGVDTTPTAPTVVRALHPSAVVLPTILAGCSSCVMLERALRAAQDARARTEHKYQIMHRRYLEMIRTQENYRTTIDRLHLVVANKDERMARAGVPVTGPVHAKQKTTKEDSPWPQ